jgi:type II secretory pathway pseudopilin PulG
MENGKCKMKKNSVNNFKNSFTLIEAIFVIVILSFVLIGGFQIISKLYVRNYIAKQTSKFEFVSQQVLDQMSEMLYYRVPLSVIGYNQSTGKFKYIGDIINTDDFPVLEWIGYLNDAMVDANLSGFADLYASKKPVLKAVDFNSGFINTILQNKYKTSKTLKDLSGIIFAGSFDRGSEGVLTDYNNSFGWHGNRADYVFRISDYTQNGNNCDLNLTNYDGSAVNGINIYEKFYLADSAYAVALKKDLNPSKWKCGVSFDKFKNSDLLLFYNYRPWLGETFCGDGGDGNVTLLASDVKSFRVKKINYHLMLKLELFKSRADINISVSKQKVAF